MTQATKRTLGGYMGAHTAAYIAGSVVLAAFQLSMNRIDWLSKAAIDTVFGDDPTRAWIPAASMFGLSILAFGTRVASRFFIFNAGRDVEYEVRRDLLAHLHTLGGAFYRKMSAGEIMSRATNDLLQIRLLTGFGILNIINVVFAFASALQVMLTISWRLTLVSFAALPVLLTVSRSFSKQLFSRTRRNQESLGALSELVQGNLSGVRVVRSFALETRELFRFDKANKEYLGASLALARLRGSMGPMLGSTAAIGVLFFFWYGGTLLLRDVDAGGISKGAFFAFSLALGRVTWPMVALGFALAIIQRGRAGWSRLEEVFQAKPEIVGGAAKAVALEGKIEVKGLSFRHGDRAILSDVSFDVSVGRSLAIVGRTGSGKTTLALLLARLLPTPRGTIFIDGRDVCDCDLAALRSLVGYAQQDAFLFSTTVARNIGFSMVDPEAAESLAQIREAAEEAHVLGEIGELPEQFDTVVGERGVQLSGGQRQRIALARALAWEPKILVLDDPLSAVDAKTEAAILDAIDRQKKERTVILITHRVAAASRCDEILLLDEGRVVERGTHAQLVAAHGIYAAFAEEQRMENELEELAEAEMVAE